MALMKKLRTADCRKCMIMASLRNAGVPTSTIQATCEGMWLNRVQRKQLLYSEGNGATHLYAIRSGKVKLFKSDSQGREHLTAILESGDLFGFEAIFDDAYAGFAEALTDCELCLASADHFKRLIADEPRIATDLARYLHRQLCQTQSRHVAITATGAAAKLAGYLLHSLEWDEDLDAADPIVARGLSLSDLGGIIGVSPETACRILTSLKAKGIVENRRTGLVLLNVDRLRRLARA